MVLFSMLSFPPPVRGRSGTGEPAAGLHCEKDVRHQCFEDIGVMGLPAANDATHLIMQSARDSMKLLLLGTYAPARCPTN